MTSQPYPRPATDLFPESLRLSPKQREVLTALQQFPEGARAIDIATELGMHVNTARGHLDELVSREAVRVFTAPAQGRGRPSLIFQVRVPDNRAIAEEYVSLIEVLSSAVNAMDTITPEVLDKAREIGRQWAHRMQAEGQKWDTAEEMLTPLYLRLRDMGFDPSVDKPQEIDGGTTTDVRLHSCPFVTDSKRPSLFVCAIHEGFIQEAMGDPGKPDSDGKIHLTLRPFAGDGTCVVSVRESPTEPGIGRIDLDDMPDVGTMGEVRGHSGPDQKSA